MSRIFLFTVCLMFSMVSMCSAVVITFDDLERNVEVTDQYSDLGIIFENTSEVDSWPSEYAPKKYPDDHAAVSYRPPAIFYFRDYIDSFSLLVTAYDITLYLEAYDDRDNILVDYSQYITKGAWHTMSLDLSGYDNVAKVVLHDTGNLFGFDDIQFTTPSSSVPEPSSMILLSLGLIGLIGVRNKSDDD